MAVMLAVLKDKKMAEMMVMNLVVTMGSLKE